MKPRKTSRPERADLNRAQMAAIAEHVAEGASISAAGRAVGISQQRASQIFARIRAELGWQAQ